MGRPVYDEGVVHVNEEKCATCIFLPGNRMDLEPGRVAEMVRGSLEEGAAITCHKTLYGQAEQEAVCRGFYDGYVEQVPALNMARDMGIIKEV